MSQLPIEGILPIYRPALNRKLTEAAIWVRRIRVLRDMAPGTEHIVRDILLRRGLNIVWAPPEQTGEDNTLFLSGVSGHTAGKSTFCRLVRYALGERNFANEGMRRRIREKLPSGWVVAEVIVDGQEWVVARPFKIGSHPFCLEAGSADDVHTASLRKDYQEYLTSLEKASATRAPANRFPTRDEFITWEHVLPWLTRDQECRFADVLEWRHSSSASDMPALAVEERQFLVRAMLGVISAEEQTEQENNARLLATKKEASQLVPLLQYRADVDRSRSEEILGLPLPELSSSIFASSVDQEFDQRRSALQAKLADLTESDDRGAAQDEVERALESTLRARIDFDEAEAHRLARTGRLRELTPPEQDALAKLTARMGVAPPGFCPVRDERARAEHCPLFEHRSIDLTAARSERAAARELETLREEVAGWERIAEQRRGILADAERVQADAARALTRAMTSYDTRRDELLREQNALDSAAALIRHARESYDLATRKQDEIASLETQIKTSYQRQEQLRASARGVIGRLSDTFDYVVRALLGNEVAARVDMSGRALSLTVERQGERESAALATVKLLAFDLAALTYSLEGKGYLPRLLIHDGPREADMARAVYERLFFYARELEALSDGEPAFQYILTTTTPPPEAMRREPWMRLELAGTPAHNRLLREDL